MGKGNGQVLPEPLKSSREEIQPSWKKEMKIRNGGKVNVVTKVLSNRDNMLIIENQSSNGTSPVKLPIDFCDQQQMFDLENEIPCLG